MTTTSALRATAHPLRLQILSLLTGAELSAAEVARELDTTQANASYHLRVLAGAGLLEPAGEERIRGGVAKRYRHPWRVSKRPAAGRSVARPTCSTARLSSRRWLRSSSDAAPSWSGGRINFTDAELWVTPEIWQDCAELVDQASTLLHDAARPPRTPGTIRVAMSAALFPMQDSSASTAVVAGCECRTHCRHCATPASPGSSAGRFISTMGSVMAPVALTFAVLDLTDSPSALGEVLAARSIPLVLFLLIGGVVADRFSRSLVMQLSHISAALTQGLVAVLLLTGTAELWMIITLEALNGIVSAFTFPAMQGVVPLVVPRSHIQQANALLGFTRNGLSVLGPTVAAIVVVTAGSGWAIAVDAVTWAVAAFCMSRVKVPPAIRSSEAPDVDGPRSQGGLGLVHRAHLGVGGGASPSA